MKRLILLRHAKSSWDRAVADDLDRPLAARGERDAPRMGARLCSRGVIPDLVLSSHAARAVRTARLVASELDLPPERVKTTSALYLASPDEILAVLSELDDAEALLVVGHNPGLTELANRLLPELRLDNLPTAGIVVIDSPVTSWRAIGAAQNRLAYFDFPKKRDPNVTAT